MGEKQVPARYREKVKGKKGLMRKGHPGDEERWRRERDVKNNQNYPTSLNFEGRIYLFFGM